MNDDIKEILDKLRSDDYYEKEYQKSTYYERDLKKLEDYITNLQQENERLKLEIERLNDVLVHKPDEKIMLKTNDGKELFIIQSERIDMQEELNKANMQLMTQLEDYKSRIEKAVEIYDDTITYLTTINAEYMDSNTKRTIQDVVNKLEKELNILLGRSEEL